MNAFRGVTGWSNEGGAESVVAGMVVGRRWVRGGCRGGNGGGGAELGGVD